MRLAGEPRERRRDDKDLRAGEGEAQELLGEPQIVADARPKAGERRVDEAGGSFARGEVLPFVVRECPGYRRAEEVAFPVRSDQRPVGAEGDKGVERVPVLPPLGDGAGDEVNGVTAGHLAESLGEGAGDCGSASGEFRRVDGTEEELRTADERRSARGRVAEPRLETPQIRLDVGLDLDLDERGGEGLHRVRGLPSGGRVLTPKVSARRRGLSTPFNRTPPGSPPEGSGGECDGPESGCPGSAMERRYDLRCRRRGARGPPPRRPLRGETSPSGPDLDPAGIEISGDCTVCRGRRPGGDEAGDDRPGAGGRGGEGEDDA